MTPLCMSMGSSPRMRGAHGGEVHPRARLGIIPAHAGSTLSISFLTSLLRDHPRACGEHEEGVNAWYTAKGSSPRMRGARPFQQSENHARRIIPAHAGSTLRPLGEALPVRDHPRACGEHEAKPSSSARLPGSSPRMRGARTRACDARPWLRIIPAHAGSTLSAWMPIMAAWDHPRACGEHCSVSTSAYSLAGSSPRMRGAPDLVELRVYPSRIIPAHAGSTRSRNSCPRKFWDHPRACGEHRGHFCIRR